MELYISENTDLISDSVPFIFAMNLTISAYKFALSAFNSACSLSKSVYNPIFHESSFICSLFLLKRKYASDKSLIASFEFKNRKIVARSSSIDFSAVFLWLITFSSLRISSLKNQCLDATIAFLKEIASSKDF